VGKAMPQNMGHGSALHDGAQHGSTKHESAGNSSAHIPCHPAPNTARDNRTDRATQPVSHHGHTHSHRIAPHGTAHEPEERGASVSASIPFHACLNCWLDCKCMGGCVSVNASFGLYADVGVLDFAGFGEAFSPLPAAALHSWLTRPNPPPPRI
jgi:hypothetical protein